jgi:hypothetical protein
MMKVEKVININGLSLLIYYTSGKCWQYAHCEADPCGIASENGSYECESIYYTPQAAEREGRRQVQMLLG